MINYKKYESGFKSISDGSLPKPIESGEANTYLFYDTVENSLFYDVEGMNIWFAFPFDKNLVKFEFDNEIDLNDYVEHIEELKGAHNG